MRVTLDEICTLACEKANVDSIEKSSYVSTESMLPNKGGISSPSSIPDKGKVTRYRKGDTLISNIRPYFKKIWHADKNGGCSNDVLVLRPSKSCDSDYLYWALSDDAFFDYMTATSKGTKMPRGDKAAIMRYQLPKHEKPQQLKIAALLQPLQEQIILNNQTNGYLEELLDVEFAEMQAEADDTWKDASLLDIANYKNGLAMQKFRPQPGDKGLPVLKIRELGQGECGPDAERCSSDIEDSVRVRDGDLIFSWSGTLMLDFWAGGDAGLNQHLFKMTSDKYPSWFYYMWTKHHMHKFIAMAKDRATTMGHIKRSALANAAVKIPPSDVLRSQTKAMQPLVDEVVGLKIQSRKLANLRDALLPKLMSGEIDVSKVDLTQPNSHLYEN